MMREVLIIGCGEVPNPPVCKMLGKIYKKKNEA